mgnify:CR=1 FL=1
MTYRLAVHRCAACQGRGYVSQELAIPELVRDLPPYVRKISSRCRILVVTRPCRQCGQTGRVQRWQRR